METRYHQTARHISVHGRAGALFRIVLATAILNAAGRTSAFISGKAPEIKPSPGGNTPSGPSADTSVRTISLLPAAGEAAAQGWSIKDGGIQLSDGVFKITKAEQ